MTPYPKIDTVFNRDHTTNKLIIGDWRRPEFECLQSTEWYVQEKIDGTNIRVMWDGEKVTFGGRTDNAQIPSHLVSVLVETFPAEKFTGQPPLCIYGEGCGAKIQKGGGNYKADGAMFVAFDVRVGRWWLQPHDVQDIAFGFGVQTAPSMGVTDLWTAVSDVQRGLESFYGEFPMEGLILRPKYGLLGRDGNRIIAKIKTKDFA